jgi:hypothetical protein
MPRAVKLILTDTAVSYYGFITRHSQRGGDATEDKSQTRCIHVVVSLSRDIED